MVLCENGHQTGFCCCFVFDFAGENSLQEKTLAYAGWEARNSMLGSCLLNVNSSFSFPEPMLGPTETAQPGAQTHTATVSYPTES